MITSTIGFLATGILWLSLPVLTLANDCFTADEILPCVLTTPPVLFGLVGAALLAAALWGAMSRPPAPPPPPPPPVYLDKVYEPSPEDMWDYEPQPGDPDYEDYMGEGMGEDE